MNKKVLVTKITLIVIALSIFFGSTIYILHSVDKHDIQTLDFVTYYTAAYLVKRGLGKDLYSTDKQLSIQSEILCKSGANRRGLMFLYLPTSVLMLYPLFDFGIISAYRLFIAINILLLLFSGLILKNIFIKRKENQKYILLPFLYLPSLMAVYSGQLSIIILLIYIFTFLTLTNKKYFISGIFSGLFLIKPQHLLIVPFLLMIAKKKKLYSFGYVITACVLIWISVKITSLHTLLNYPSFLLKTNTPHFYVGLNDVHTIYPYLEKMTGIFGLNRKIALLINFILYGLTLVFFEKKIRYLKSDLYKQLISALLISIVFMVRIYSYDLVVVLIPIFYMLGKTKIVAYKVFAVLLYLTSFISLLKVSYLASFVFLIIGICLLENKSEEITQSRPLLWLKILIKKYHV